jgi:hypothetical protein
MRALPSLLEEEKGLGAHTSVILLTRTFGLDFFWCNSEIRPWGDKALLQCSKCHAVRTLKFKAGRQRGIYEFCCNKCKEKGEKNVLIKDGILPKAANGSGWGNKLIYGRRSDVQDNYDAPRKDYDKI